MATAKPTDTTAPADGVATAAPADDVVTEFPLSVEEWCTQLSATDRRPELIGAFASVETRAGRGRALPSAYAKRYAEFIKTPA